MKNKTLLLLAAGLFCGTLQAAESGHGEAPGKSVDELVPVCATCHGPQGDQPIAPNYPVLAGQYANYLEHSLKSYRDGSRKNPIMAAQAANLSDHDIKLLSQYFSMQPGPLHTPKGE